MFCRNALAVIALLSFAWVLGAEKTTAQCCSAGSPAGVGTYAGMVGKNSLRITTFGRYTRSKDYYKGDSKLENPLVVENSNFVFQGLSISYGIPLGIALDLDLGYFYLKDQSYTSGYYLKAYGLSNGVFMIKKNLLHATEKRLDLSCGVGLKFPFSTQALYIDNVRMPIDLQPSTRALGVAAQLFLKKNLIPYRLSFYFFNRYEYNFKNSDDYRFGDKLRSSLMLEGNLTQKLGAIFQARFEYSGYDYDFYRDEVFHHSGSYLVFVSPMLVYSIVSKWHLSLSADFPIYKFYNGTQLANRFSVALNLTRDFSLSKKEKTE